MAGRIKDTSKSLPKIVSTSKTYRTIKPEEVAKALGAEKIPDSSIELGGSPPALFGLRQELYRRLRSTGGRRSLEGAGKRRKIPLFEGDWERLQAVAEANSGQGFHPTPAQVASILLHQALEELESK